MKNLYLMLTCFLVSLIFNSTSAQDMYIKATLATGNKEILTKDASPNAPTNVTDIALGSKPIDLSDYMTVSSLSYETEQTLSIGSQTTGAGAGKVTFNPLVVTKKMDASSSKLFIAQCQGKTMDLEILFVAASGTLQRNTVINKITMQTAAVKTIASASSGDCASCPINESISFEYGAIRLYTYSQDNSGTVTALTPVGWNRITNTVINP